MKKLLFILFFFALSFSGFAQHQYTSYVTASGTNTYAVTVSVPTITNYSTKRIHLRFANANSGASTLNVTPVGASPLGAVAIRAWDGDSWEALTGGEIVTGVDYVVVYNGTYFELYASLPGSGGGAASDYVIEAITGTGPQTITDADNGKIFIYTNASGCAVLLGDGVTEGKSFTAIRAEGAGNIEFQADGTASLHTVNDEFIIETDEGWASWVMTTSDEWRGTGVLGPASGGGGGTWGSITGTLSDQTDLQTALDGKVNDTGNETIAGTKTFSSTIVGSINGNAATVTTNANLTGHVTSTGNATVLGSFSSSNLSGALSDESGSGLAMFSERTANVQTASYVLTLSDRSSEVYMNVATANTVTVPTNASVAFPVGTKVTIIRTGAGATSVVASGGVTINSSSGTLAGPSRYNLMMLTKVATDEWYLWNGEPLFAGAALTATDGQFDFTVTNGSTALVNAANFTATLNGLPSVAVGSLITANATNTFTEIAAVTAGRYLRSAGTGTVPVWSTLTLPNSLNANRILYGTSANTAGESANLTYDGSLFTVAGGMAAGYAAKTTTYTLTSADRFIECTSGSFTVTLPTAVGRTGIMYTIDNSGAGTITLATTASQTIDGSSPGTLTAGQKITLYSNGANWRTW